MSKQLLGNLVSYTGKYLSKAKAKASNGNLVFAKITGSTTLAEDHADYDKDGYYIYAGGAEGHLVDLDTFKVLRKELKELIGTGEYEMPKHGDGSYYSIKEYVDGRISSLGTVMNFAGVTTTNVTAEGATASISINGEDYTAKKGDVVIYNGEEFVWDGQKWHEIGQVKGDEAIHGVTITNEDVDKKGYTKTVKDATNGTIDITLNVATTSEDIEDTTKDYLVSAASVRDYVASEIGKIPEDVPYTGADAISVEDHSISLGLDDTGNVTLSQSDKGLKAEVTAENITYQGETLEGQTGPTTSAKNVKEALDDLYKDSFVTAQAIIDLKDRVDVVEGTAHVDSIKSGSTNLTVDKETGDVTVSLVEASFTEKTSGIATDTYVKDYISDLLSWEILGDE